MKPIDQLCHTTAEYRKPCPGNHENVGGGRHAYELSSVNHELGNMSDATVMLAAIKAGDSNAVEELLDLVYDELRRLAAAKLALEAPGQTLQPTALVHEAWLRLVGHQTPAFKDRGHFFRACAEAMRWILIDRVRHKQRIRHGGGYQRVDLENLDLAAPVVENQLMALNEALDKFVLKYPAQAEMVKLRYFVGLTNEEAAEVLGISVTTAKKYWTFSRAWLLNQMESEQGGEC